MPFMRTTDRVWNANHLGRLNGLGEVTSADVTSWLNVGGSLLSASAPLIQTFVPNTAQQQFQQFVDTLNKNVNPVAPGAAPQPPPPAIPMTPTVQPGFVIPTWAPWAALGAVGAFVVARMSGGGGRGSSRRSNPVFGDPSTKYTGFASNPRRRRRHRRRKNPWATRSFKYPGSQIERRLWKSKRAHARYVRGQTMVYGPWNVESRKISDRQYEALKALKRGRR